MALDANSPKYSLDTVLPKLGSVLAALFEEGKKKTGDVNYQGLLQKMSVDTDAEEFVLLGALAILRGMGLIHMDVHGKVEVISRHACYVIGSLSKFLSAAIPAADEGRSGKERDYLISLTKALECSRVEKAQVDDKPLHARRIVNVLIKSRQIRHWRSQDVYLHVYHHQWEQYHLLGLSHKDDSKTDEEIAQLALVHKLGLSPDQYTLDTVFKPPEVTLQRMSATSGALTEYTYRLMAVKEIRVKLKLNKWIKEGKFDRNWFRWFTWEEIKQRESEQGEPIMFSTPVVMERIGDRSSIPLSVPKADDVRNSIDILNELSCRITKKQFGVLGGLLLLVILFPYLPYLYGTNPLLNNLASIATICTVIIPWAIILGGVFKNTFRKS